MPSFQKAIDFCAQNVSHLQEDPPFSEILKTQKEMCSIARLPGDASTRRYFRGRTETGTFIVMHTDPFSNEGENFPFLAVQDLLAANGIDVPKVLAIRPDLGLIFLEDLGDDTLLRRLQSVSDSQTEKDHYETAIRSLVALHTRCVPENAKKPIDGFSLAFDHEKLMWEVAFTIEHFYLKHLGRELTTRDQRIIEGGFSRICKKLENEPRVLCHRDFHSRNIMVTEPKNRFVMIDFQDARMGPAQYDLASLLKDSYYQLEESQIESLLAYYCDQVDSVTGSPLDRDHFRAIFDLMGVQRNFKAIGSFASFLNRRGIATYLKYIGNTFENIRRCLLKYPEYSDLREVLFHYYYF